MDAQWTGSKAWGHVGRDSTQCRKFEDLLLDLQSTIAKRKMPQTNQTECKNETSFTFFV